MDTRELLQKLTALPISARSLAEDLLAGNFSSIFRGQGMEFDEVRHYEAGDDIRSIDWNASARFGTPFVKMYREERDLTIMILLDTSASMRRGIFARESAGGSGAGLLNPYEQGLLAAALIAFSAEHTGQRVGAFFFDREVEQVFHPRKGRRHIMALVSLALRYQQLEKAEGGYNIARNSTSNITIALAGARHFLKRRSLVVIISDFFSANWEHELCDLCRGHDVIALRIRHPLETDLSGLGFIVMEDPETGLRIDAPTGFGTFRESWFRWHRERSEHWAVLCRRAGASCLELSTQDDAAATLLRFFESDGKAARRSAYVRKGRG